MTGKCCDEFDFYFLAFDCVVVYMYVQRLALAIILHTLCVPLACRICNGMYTIGYA